MRNQGTADYGEKCMKQGGAYANIIGHGTRDVKVSRPAWSQDQFFGVGLGLTVIGLGLMKYWPRVSYALVSWSQRGHLLS